MLKLPENKPLSEQITELLKEEGCQKRIRLPLKDGTHFTMDCPFLTSPNGVTLCAGLEQERTEAGSGFTWALWSERPVEIWLCGKEKTIRIDAFVYRSHIAGPILKQFLLWAREKNPEGEISVVWELLAERWETTVQAPPAPQEQHLKGPAEIHLDNPAIFRESVE